jgi:hypothetical protein
LAKGPPVADCGDNARPKTRTKPFSVPRSLPDLLHCLGERSAEAGGSIKISEDVRQCAAEQGIAEEEAIAKGIEEMSNEFVENGAEVYTPV